MNKPKQDVAVFIDFENIYVSVREKFDATPNFEALMEKCEDYGRVVVARAYADWYRYPRITSALFANNIEPMYVPTYYYDKDEGRTGRPIKNSVDMHMCIDAMRTLYTRTNIDTYIFITGDRDFIALVNCVRQEGKDVIIVGIGGAASGHLAQSADEFLFYEQIVDIRPMSQSGRRLERTERPSREDRLDRGERGERVDERRREDRAERINGREERRRREDRAERQPEKLLEFTDPRVGEKPEKAAASAAPASQKPADQAASQKPEPAATQGASESPAATPERAPIVAIPTVSAEMAVYDKLVEALALARKRGYVSSFGSLKVLMKELMPNFKESRYRNEQGKPFTKFTDFVREAERLGKIQIFTSGTVNEVFLPDEDPYKLSQFAEDLPSVEAERELEQELAAEAATHPADADGQAEAAEAGDEAPSSEDRAERTGRRRRRRGGQNRDAAAVADAQPDAAESESLEENVNFGEREWALFNRVMSAYSEPVPFADIFNDLREMRNAEELDLTNNALKELIKQAINAGKVQRSNRGAKAHYRLITPVVPQQPVDDAPDLPELEDDLPAPTTSASDAQRAPRFAGSPAEVELPDLIDDFEPIAGHSATPSSPRAAVGATPALPNMIRGEELVVASQIQPLLAEPEFEAPGDPQLAETASPASQAPTAPETVAEAGAPKTTRRRRKVAEPAPTDGSPEAPTLAAEPLPASAAQGAPATGRSPEEQPKAPRRTRRSKSAEEQSAPASAQETSQVSGSPEPEAEAKPATRRRRKKVETSPATQGVPGAPAAEGDAPASTDGVE